MKLKLTLVLIGIVAISGCGKAPPASKPQFALSVTTDKAGITALDLRYLKATLASFREVPKSDFHYLSAAILPPVRGVAVLDSGRLVAWSFYFCGGLHLRMLDGSERFFLPR